MAEEWVKDARNEARVEANLRAKTNKALGAAEQKNKELATKLTVEERVWKNVEASLQNAQDQAKDQRKKLYHTEIELAIGKQQVLKLKAELQRAKGIAWTAEEMAEALRQVSYDLEVEETKVCRGYC